METADRGVAVKRADGSGASDDFAKPCDELDQPPRIDGRVFDERDRFADTRHAIQ